MARWNRLSHISPEERKCLEKITDTTKGMALYGNKARLAVMVESDLVHSTWLHKSKIFLLESCVVDY